MTIYMYSKNRHEKRKRRRYGVPFYYIKFDKLSIASVLCGSVCVHEC